MTTRDDFPRALDRWTGPDWAEYRRQVEDGSGSVRAIESVQRRRRRQAQAEATEGGTP
ncbi:hypothetical protein AB0L85_13350 [Streptomyces sp. NPDC052051]|uniref:hypothetical protein n=1 Tax=Streptomyces sp. NPDC052051 TaxID=3154649 RepID=UPI003438CCA3